MLSMNRHCFNFCDNLHLFQTQQTDYDNFVRAVICRMCVWPDYVCTAYSAIYISCSNRWSLDSFLNNEKIQSKKKITVTHNDEHILTQPFGKFPMNVHCCVTEPNTINCCWCWTRSLHMNIHCVVCRLYDQPNCCV